MNSLSQFKGPYILPPLHKHTWISTKCCAELWQPASSSQRQSPKRKVAITMFQARSLPTRMQANLSSKSNPNSQPLLKVIPLSGSCQHRAWHSVQSIVNLDRKAQLRPTIHSFLRHHDEENSTHCEGVDKESGAKMSDSFARMWQRFLSFLNFTTH